MYAILLLFLIFPFLHGNDMKGFDDTEVFDTNWPGNIDQLNTDESEEVILTTGFKEKCILPYIQEKEQSTADSYDGPTPLELISPLFSQRSCSCNLDLAAYWTYEVCHGRYIQQYHVDNDGRKVTIHEYILGRWDKNYYEVLRDRIKSSEKENKNAPMPVKTIDGISLPYFEVTMTNGTQCELNQNRPRETKVIYVCSIHGKNEIFSINETSTCAYEVVILSPLLCSHPKYKPQETGKNQINCLPLKENANKHRKLMKMKKEAMKLRRRSNINHIRVKLHPLDLREKEEIPKVPKSPIDTSPVES